MSSGSLNAETTETTYQKTETLSDKFEGKVFGVLGAPGAGKTYVMSIIEEASDFIGERLNINRPIMITVVKKSTTRESRGDDDRLKEAGVDPSEFTEEKMIGIYTLSNNGQQYGYRRNSFEVKAHLSIAEPSIHHLKDIRDYLGSRLFTISLIASRSYRNDRLNGRGTEDVEQVNKRLNEGDLQIYMLNKIVGGLKTHPRDLMDKTLHDLLEQLESTNFEDTSKLEALVGSQASEFVDVLKRLEKDPSLIHHIVYLDESYLSTPENPNTKLRDEVLDSVIQAISTEI